jgi:hypothetical protein
MPFSTKLCDANTNLQRTFDYNQTSQPQHFLRQIASPASLLLCATAYAYTAVERAIVISCLILNLKVWLKNVAEFEFEVWCLMLCCVQRGRKNSLNISTYIFCMFQYIGTNTILSGTEVS